jgi:ribosome modulation factor
MANRTKKDAQQPKPAKEKAAKAPKSAKSAKAHNTAAAGDQRTEDQIRQGFIHHRQAWNVMTAKQKALDKQWTDTKAALKSDGYKVIQMQIADDLAGSPKAEAKVHAAVKDRLQVARWIGHPMGKNLDQFDLFAQPDRTPAVDRAHDQGKQAAMEGKRASPPYDPSVPQHQEWLKGFHSVQDARVRDGIKPVEAAGWGDRDPSRPLDA